MDEKLYNELVELGLNQEEINQFIKCKEKGIILPRNLHDVEIARKMREICNASSEPFSVAQQQVILNALIKGVDATKLANPEYSNDTMEFIFCGLTKGIDITKFFSQFSVDFEPYVFRNIIMAHENGLSSKQIKDMLSLYNKFKTCDISYIRYCLEDGISKEDIVAANPKTTNDLKELRNNNPTT